jgi:hypothetical protein
VSDVHIRLLRRLASQAQRELAEHHAIHQIQDAAYRRRGERLERAATRTGARLADAQTRRRHRLPEPAGG